MKRLNAFMLISLGLTTLTISFVLIGTWIWDVFPDQTSETFALRKTIVENLAAQYSKLAEKDDLATIQASIEFLLTRNSDIRSIALVDSKDKSLAVTGPHHRAWTKRPQGPSSITNLEVDIYNGLEPWGTLQVAFQPPFRDQGWWSALIHDPLYRFLGYIALVGFPGFYLFIRRVLRNVDPSTIVPRRVKTVLDTLAEGVVLLDGEGRVVLANTAFLRISKATLQTLMGKSLDFLPWKDPANLPVTPASLPWQTVKQTNQSQTDIPLAYALSEEEIKEFTVNSTPIIDEENQLRGILVSFSDVTELTQANHHLFATLEELHRSQTDIQQQNEKLQWLATRDQLTGALNRHAFFEKLEASIQEAQSSHEPLGCLMLDMDNFKMINDRYGHMTGDQVLKMLADSIVELIRPEDYVGRYGGEEFCAILPGMTEIDAKQMGERIRQYIEERGSQVIRATSLLEITTSIGVASVSPEDPEPLRVIEQADEALYAAKTGGKNRVACYSTLSRNHPSPHFAKT